MDHMNTIDNTGNIKFTHKEETNRTITSLDMKSHHKDDGSMNNTVLSGESLSAYREP